MAPVGATGALRLAGADYDFLPEDGGMPLCVEERGGDGAARRAGLDTGDGVLEARDGDAEQNAGNGECDQQI